MATGKGGDAYSQVIYGSVMLSAANTLTFKKVDIITGALLGSKQYGLLIARIEWLFINAAIQEMTANGDSISLAVTVSEGIADLGMNHPELIATESFERHDAGAAASGQFINKPSYRDYTGLPGGGLLIPADRLFLAGTSLGLAGGTLLMGGIRIYYTSKELTPTDYLELIQARTMITA